MRIVYKRCCGMDVHKDSVSTCVLVIDEYGEWRSEKQRFRTMTCNLREMSRWFASLGVEAIAMEATGVYWKPGVEHSRSRAEVPVAFGERASRQECAGAEDRPEG